MSDSEPFYMPDPDLFGHANAYPLYTGFAAELEEAGLRAQFPPEPELRKIVIEILAEGEYTVEDLAEEPDLIDEAVIRAREILEERKDS